MLNLVLEAISLDVPVDFVFVEPHGKYGESLRLACSDAMYWKRIRCFPFCMESRETLK